MEIHFAITLYSTWTMWRMMQADLVQVTTRGKSLNIFKKCIFQLMKLSTIPQQQMHEKNPQVPSHPCRPHCYHFLVTLIFLPHLQIHHHQVLHSHFKGYLLLLEVSGRLVTVMILIYAWQMPFLINEIKRSIRKLLKLAVYYFGIVWPKYESSLKNRFLIFHKNLWKKFIMII